MRALLPIEKEAIHAMARRPEGAVFLKYLEENMAASTKVLINGDDPLLVRKHQGAAIVLGELVEAWRG